ncbi:SDR family oxidoreductase [Streptomyces sp. NBC_00193]|uniref:SDR family NAD(P)-dependent oxidoreductase n=1 Tax=unclassified Streptomyces TaxID=2593676 RepID=UPI00224EE39F|nr:MULTISPECIES: SDR family oxidoreductase [unclassified Streptomyces]MCX5128328.1 SDR family oxidoreductase [Streptomyces sp. NBC_00347]MCX5300791.1 SDR family oxidoreductase [Streptomyces sp. NBC_00193]
MAEVRTGGLGFFELTGKVAVVTGGSSGIGAACARRLAEAGARVVVGYYSGEGRAKDLVAALPGDGHSTTRIPLDDSAAVRRAAELVADRHGVVDVLVNSAGTTTQVAHADLEGLTDAEFDRILTVNVRGTFSVIRAFTPLLRSSGDAVIANISSISASTGLGSSIAYCAAKAGLDVMATSLARVLGPQVRVFNLSPAAVDTGFVPGRDPAAVRTQAESAPLRIAADPDDVACSLIGAVTSLRLSTGTVVVIDGGVRL